MAYTTKVIWGFMLENTYFMEFDVCNHRIIEQAYHQRRMRQTSHYITIRDSHLPAPARIYFGVAQVHLRMPGTRYYVKRRVVQRPIPKRTMAIAPTVPAFSPSTLTSSKTYTAPAPTTTAAATPPCYPPCYELSQPTCEPVFSVRPFSSPLSASSSSSSSTSSSASTMSSASSVSNASISEYTVPTYSPYYVCPPSLSSLGRYQTTVPFDMTLDPTLAAILYCDNDGAPLQPPAQPNMYPFQRRFHQHVPSSQCAATSLAQNRCWNPSMTEITYQP
ncbi:uncharacterized protein BYT42DRAFT_608644 [Radiomyces spectabilis]|uniref:uncharacterized protein n=1 Tax=Radiomyces spectabilis TaxID=64574 RepID=UPI0022203000|nr:uncharacterized protein BYT42DRAFT_608644 [Radiomyces spectabilis]KAI8366032.1 hypothetical protein BYT42DRAFT_608644 [Radiomyces spectabilis]